MKYSPLVAIVFAISSAYAAESKVGMSIAVDGDGVFWNPIVNTIRVTQVEVASLAQIAGIVAGDEIIKIEGQQVAGKRAKDLQAYMKFSAGESRTLLVKHVSGEQFLAKISKPKE